MSPTVTHRPTTFYAKLGEMTGNESTSFWELSGIQPDLDKSGFESLVTFG